MRTIPVWTTILLLGGLAGALAQQGPPRTIDDLLGPRLAAPRSPPMPPPRPSGIDVPAGAPDIALPSRGGTAPSGQAHIGPRQAPVGPKGEARIANPTAVFSGLDKITGRIFPFEAAIDETVQFGALQVTARACYTRPPTDPQNTTGFVEVDEITLDGDVKRIFTGWMFAASPGLNAVEHAIYDVWLVDCKPGPPDIAKPAEPAG
jgi:hypothetical protein